MKTIEIKQIQLTLKELKGLVEINTNQERFKEKKKAVLIKDFNVDYVEGVINFVYEETK